MNHAPISSRLSQPTPEDIRCARKQANLTQGEAAQLISPAKTKPYATWQGYEMPVGAKGHRAIPLATWELFLLLTAQHPSLRLCAASPAEA